MGQEAEEAYLRLDKHGSETVKKLKWGDNLALHKSTGENRRRRPPSCAKWHLPEPSLKRKARLSTDSSIASSHHLIHICDMRFNDVWCNSTGQLQSG
jgi:hypothetical protein